MKEIFSQELRLRILALNTEDAEGLLLNAEKLNDIVVKGVPEDLTLFSIQYEKLIRHIASLRWQSNSRLDASIQELESVAYAFLASNSIVITPAEMTNNVYLRALLEFLNKLYRDSKIDVHVYAIFHGNIFFRDKVFCSIMLACLIDLESILTIENSEDYLYLFTHFSIASVHNSLKLLKDTAVFVLGYSWLTSENMRLLVKCAKENEDLPDRNLFLLMRDVANYLDGEALKKIPAQNDAPKKRRFPQGIKPEHVFGPPKKSVTDSPKNLLLDADLSIILHDFQKDDELDKLNVKDQSVTFVELLGSEASKPSELDGLMQHGFFVKQEAHSVVEIVEVEENVINTGISPSILVFANTEIEGHPKSQQDPITNTLELTLKV